ncbi:TNT domain-containing protein [Actinocorallia sp. B10E7]|uniref:TNT domain-containing protein n=1 Tax=Actinocorallia sp. B10E7 TaxID=3153558 RepID=UPI00325DFA64
MRVFRRGVTSAAALGLVVTLTGTAASARPDGAGAPREGVCAAPSAASPAEIIKRAEACSHEPGRRKAVPTTEKAVAMAVRNAIRAEARVCGPPYVLGDWRLGPARLPRKGYFGYLLRGYNRYGKLPPSRFLYQYWDENKTPSPDWRYPPDDGFARQLRDINSRLARYKTTLRVGQYLDRFGSENGRFLSPAGASFGSRALPPSNLNTRDDDRAHLCGYHLYRVTRSFFVDAGPAIPAFQQPGKGLQYVLTRSYISDPTAPDPLTTKWLADNGYLERVY